MKPFPLAQSQLKTFWWCQYEGGIQISNELDGRG